MKNAIIIGATSGIGRKLAEIFVQNGYVTGVTGRRESLLQSFQATYAGKVFIKKMDVQHFSTIESTCNELANEMGGVDVLIICAGIGEENEALSFETENDVIKTNVQGFTCLCNWGMRFFKNQGSGHLINISSVAGLRGNGLAPSYNASKAYQINYLEGLRLNALKSNLPIYVTDVRPGFVATAMAKGDGLFWVASVEKATEQIYRAIKRQKNVLYVSKRWRMIGYILKLIPFSIFKRL